MEQAGTLLASLDLNMLLPFASPPGSSSGGTTGPTGPTGAQGTAGY
jgi:hypothetical protein